MPDGFTNGQIADDLLANYQRFNQRYATATENAEGARQARTFTSTQQGTNHRHGSQASMNAQPKGRFTHCPGKTDNRDDNDQKHQPDPVLEKLADRDHGTSQEWQCLSSPLEYLNHFRDRKSTRLNSSHVKIS